MGMLFAHPALRGIEPGTARWFEAQRELIRSKPLVRQCYDLWYALLRRDACSVPGTGKVVELGSGAGYLRDFLPEVITSDVMPGPWDMVIDGRELPFEAGELRAILLTHVFHHIPDVEAFFREALRTLVPGGVISMIDCAHTPLSRVFFGKIHPEPYLPEQKEWVFQAGNNLLDSNQAFSWMLFERDKVIFARKFPGFAVENKSFLPWLGYLLNGGVNLRSLVPHGLVWPVRWLDNLSRGLDKICAIHWHITIRKKI